MKSFLAIAVGLASLSMAPAGEMSVRYESKTVNQCVTDANGKTTCVPVTTVVPVVFMTTPVSTAVNTLAVVPRGHHAHKMSDGSTMIHADSNYGDPVAHAGVLGDGWPKTATAGQVVQLGVASASCPTGTCPTSVSSVSTIRTRETIFTSGRLFSRLFGGRLRGLFAGGCP